MNKIYDDYVVIGFSTSKNPFAVGSFLIRAIEQVDFSHTYLQFFCSSLNRWLIYQASHGAVNFENINTFHKKSRDLYEYEIPVTKEEKAKILQFCVDNVGIPYGKSQIVGMAVIRLINQLGFKFKNPCADGPKTMVCSELVGYLLEILGKRINQSTLELEGPKLIRKKVEELFIERSGCK
jgi:hypothetical protein